MGKLKTHSPMYCIKEACGDLLNIMHPPDRMNLTIILYVNAFW